MKKIQHIYQSVFVMVDGAEFAWKCFGTWAAYREYVKSVPQDAMKKIGIESISYRVRYID